MAQLIKAVRVTLVNLTCHNCRRTYTVPSDGQQYQCTACGVTLDEHPQKTASRRSIRPKKSQLVSIAAVAIIGTVIMIAFAFVAFWNRGKPASVPPKASATASDRGIPPYEPRGTGIIELSDEFSQNSVAAEQKYGRSRRTLYGIIKEVGKDQFDGHFVEFVSTDKTVRAYLRDGGDPAEVLNYGPGDLLVLEAVPEFESGYRINLRGWKSLAKPGLAEQAFCPAGIDVLDLADWFSSDPKKAAEVLDNRIITVRGKYPSGELYDDNTAAYRFDTQTKMGDVYCWLRSLEQAYLNRKVVVLRGSCHWASNRIGKYVVLRKCELLANTSGETGRVRSGKR